MNAAPALSPIAALMDLAAAAEAPVAQVGGKGRQLGQLLQLGLPVPGGFVITAQALADAFTGTPRDATRPPPLPDALLAVLDAELRKRGWEGTPLAVRSSAPQEDSQKASFAGIHRSELNVIGAPALARAIAAVWSSLWTAHAAAYRQRLGIADADAAMAVVVMPLVPARLSGVAFTCDPRSGRDDRYVINAVSGLGKALVGGSENGETIVLEERRDDDAFIFVERQPARQNVRVVPAPEGGTRHETLPPGGSDAAPLLDDARAIELARLLRDAAQALDYADPCFDIEWVCDGERFHLVQARPVTARPWHCYLELAGQAAIWTNGNSRDVAPLPMNAMDWFHWRGMVDTMLEQGHRLAGFPLLAGARRFALLGGRLYINAALVQWEGYSGFGITPKQMNGLMGGHQPEITVPPATWRLRLAWVRHTLRYLVGARALRRQGKAEAAQAFAEARRWRQDDLTSLADATLAGRLAANRAYFRNRIGMAFLQGSGGANLYQLVNLVETQLPGEGHALVAAVMAGGPPSVSAQQGYDLAALASAARAEPAARDWLRQGAPWDLARLPADSPFRRGFADFLDRYGHRGIYESYLRNPRFRENPDYLLDTVAGLVDADLGAIARRRDEAARTAWSRLQRGLPWAKRLAARVLVGIARNEIGDRELARSAFIACAEVSRRLLLEAGRRLAQRGTLHSREEVFDLTHHELDDALNGRIDAQALAPRVAARRRRQAEWEAQTPPEVILGSAAEARPQPPAEPAAGNVGADCWTGVAVGCGTATGVARLIHRPEDGIHLAPGEILVAPSTDPAWTPLFLKAGGLVMETGGYLSHGAIVAREFGIPAVVNLPGILAALASGETVEVDGSRGTVRRSAPAPTESTP